MLRGLTSRCWQKVRELVVPSMTCHGPIEAWIIEDTSFPMKGPAWSGCSPQGHIPSFGPKNPALPMVIDPAALPIRPPRHAPNSIAAIYRLLAVAIARTLHRCQCCARRFPQPQAVFLMQ
jgi:hypothetical protein